MERPAGNNRAGFATTNAHVDRESICDGARGRAAGRQYCGAAGEAGFLATPSICMAAAITGGPLGAKKCFGTVENHWCDFATHLQKVHSLNAGGLPFAQKTLPPHPRSSGLQYFDHNNLESEDRIETASSGGPMWISSVVRRQRCGDGETLGRPRRGWAQAAPAGESARVTPTMQSRVTRRASSSSFIPSVPAGRSGSTR